MALLSSAVNFNELAVKGFGAVVLDDSLFGGAAKKGASLGIGEGLAHGLGEAVGLAGSNEPAVVAIADEFAGAAEVAGNDGARLSGGFEDDVGAVFRQ